MIYSQLMGKAPASLKELYKKLPKFPGGRIDYTNSSKAAILICFLEYQGKILLLKRSNKVGIYKNLWSPIAGYLDELKPLKDKVQEELKEELGILEKDITVIKFGEIFEFTDKKIKKTWIINPVMIVLKEKPTLKLDWEHTEYTWISPREIMTYKITPTTIESLKRVML